MARLTNLISVVSIFLAGQAAATPTNLIERQGLNVQCNIGDPGSTHAAMQAAIDAIDQTSVFGFLNQGGFPPQGACKSFSNNSPGQFCCEVASATDANGKTAHVLMTASNLPNVLGCSDSKFLAVSGKQVQDSVTPILNTCTTNQQDDNSGRNKIDSCIIFHLGNGPC